MDYIDLCSRQPKPAPIEVGSQWERKSDGKQCVVVCQRDGEHGIRDVVVRYAGAPHNASYMRGGFTSVFTYLFTPLPDLSNVPDGAKIVGFDGVVVTKQTNGDGWRELLDCDGGFHSVNGLPSYVSPDGDMFWYRECLRHREEGAADECADGEKFFWLHDELLSPEEWGREIATNPAYDASKVLPEYRHLLPAEEPETVVAEVGLRVDIQWDSKSLSGTIDEVGSEWIHVSAVNMQMHFCWRGGEWHSLHLERTLATITHQGRSVVLPDHIPDGGKLIEEPRVVAQSKRYPSVFLTIANKRTSKLRDVYVCVDDRLICLTWYDHVAERRRVREFEWDVDSYTTTDDESRLRVLIETEDGESLCPAFVLPTVEEPAEPEYPLSIQDVVNSPSGARFQVAGNAHCLQAFVTSRGFQLDIVSPSGRCISALEAYDLRELANAKYRIVEEGWE